MKRTQLFFLGSCILLPACSSVKQQLDSLAESLSALHVRVGHSASKQLIAFLEAFNKDENTLDAFIKAHFKSPDDMSYLLDFQDQVGTLILKSIEKDTPTGVISRMQENESKNIVTVTLELEDHAPYRITNVGIMLKSRPAAAQPMTIKKMLRSLKKHLATLEKKNRFSGAILIAEHGKPIFEQAYGFADREHKITNKIDTKFNLGSMNKMFTAIAIAQLVQAGKCKFADTIGDIIVDYPNADVAKVTIEQLLTHMGCTGDVFGPEYTENLEKLKTPNDYIALFGKRGLDCEPGTEWRYSNYGFVLLGAIIEKIAGKSYYDYIRDHIYKPMGMINSDSYFKTEKVPNMAIGYLRFIPTDLRTNYDTLPIRGFPAGGGYSTVEDLLRFANGLEQHTLLNKTYTALVTTGKVAVAPGPDSPKYAYGFQEGMTNGVRYFGHAGGADCINSELRVYPATGYTIIAMDNTGKNASPIVNWIAERLPVK